MSDKDKNTGKKLLCAFICFVVSAKVPWMQAIAACVSQSVCEWVVEAYRNPQLPLFCIFRSIAVGCFARSLGYGACLSA